MTANTDILGPPLSKSEALDLERKAKRHYKTAARSVAQFAADLRRLQDGAAHLVRGFDNFGTYVEHTFDGISAASAKQLSRQGHALIVLEDNGRISLEGQGRDIPGPTGQRMLASVLNQFGEERMLEVYDAALILRPGRAVVGESVKQALRDLLPPSPVAIAPPEQPHFEEGDDDGTAVEEAMEPATRVDELRQMEEDLEELMHADDSRPPTPEETAALRRQLMRLRMTIDSYLEGK